MNREVPESWEKIKNKYSFHSSISVFDILRQHSTRKWFYISAFKFAHNSFVLRSSIVNDKKLWIVAVHTCSIYIFHTPHCALINSLRVIFLLLCSFLIRIGMQNCKHCGSSTVRFVCKCPYLNSILNSDELKMNAIRHSIKRR